MYIPTYGLTGGHAKIKEKTRSKVFVEEVIMLWNSYSVKKNSFSLIKQFGKSITYPILVFSKDPYNKQN